MRGGAGPGAGVHVLGILLTLPARRQSLRQSVRVSARFHARPCHGPRIDRCGAEHCSRREWRQGWHRGRRARPRPRTRRPRSRWTEAPETGHVGREKLSASACDTAASKEKGPRAAGWLPCFPAPLTSRPPPSVRDPTDGSDFRKQNKCGATVRVNDPGRAGATLQG